MGESLPDGRRDASPARGTPLDRLARTIPGIGTARQYRAGWLSSDLVAGLALTAVLVPASMGYAAAIGLPPITGLYAATLPLLAYAIFGPSRLLMVGPDSSLVPLVAAAVVPITSDLADRAGLAALLAVMAGLLVAAAGVARLGVVTDFLSIPVRQAYLNGIAALVIASQLPTVFGFSVAGQTLVDELAGWFGAIRDGRTNLVALAVGLASLGVILAVRRWRPRVPGILAAVAGATLVSALLDLHARSGLLVVGDLPRGLPMPTLPPLDPGLVLALLPAAFSIALVSATDMTVLAETYAARGRYEADENRELVGLGAANLASGLFGGFAVSSSATRTPIAEAAGAKTQLTGVVAAVAIAGLLVLAPWLLAALPIATLGAVVIAAGLTLVDVDTFTRLWRVRRSEFAFAAACFLGVALVGVIPGIFFAVGLSLLAFVRSAWQPHDAVLGRAHGVKGYHDLRYYPEAKQIPGLLLYRFDAPLFFANGEVFMHRILRRISESTTPVRWVVVAAEPITDVDTTAAEAIDLLLDDLDASGITLAFAELKDPVKDRLRRYGTLARIGEARCYPTLGTAVDAYVTATGERWIDWEDALRAERQRAKAAGREVELPTEETLVPDAVEEAVGDAAEATSAGPTSTGPSLEAAPDAAAEVKPERDPL